MRKAREERLGFPSP